MLRTRAPLYSGCPFRARLACVRHAASVRSEPGSNSPIVSWVSLNRHPRTPSSPTRRPVALCSFQHPALPVQTVSSRRGPGGLQAPNATRELTAGLHSLLTSLGLLSSFQRPSDAPLSCFPRPAFRPRGRGFYRRCVPAVKRAFSARSAAPRSVLPFPGALRGGAASTSAASNLSSGLLPACQPRELTFRTAKASSVGARLLPPPRPTWQALNCSLASPRTSLACCRGVLRGGRHLSSPAVLLSIT